MVTLKFTNEFPKDVEIEIVIEYDGLIQEEMAGFYRR